MSFLWRTGKIKKHNKIPDTWYVQCHDCGVRTVNSTKCAYESWKDAKQYPVKMWNRRVDYAEADSN